MIYFSPKFLWISNKIFIEKDNYLVLLGYTDKRIFKIYHLFDVKSLYQTNQMSCDLMKQSLFEGMSAFLYILCACYVSDRCTGPKDVMMDVRTLMSKKSADQEIRKA